MNDTESPHNLYVFGLTKIGWCAKWLGLTILAVLLIIFRDVKVSQVRIIKATDLVLRNSRWNLEFENYRLFVHEQFNEEDLGRINIL